MITLLLAINNDNLTAAEAAECINRNIPNQIVKASDITQLTNIFRIAIHSCSFYAITAKSNKDFIGTINSTVIPTAAAQLERFTSQFTKLTRIANVVEFYYESQHVMFEKNNQTLITASVNYHTAMNNPDNELPGILIVAGDIDAAALEANGYTAAKGGTDDIRVFTLAEPNDRVVVYATRDYVGFHDPKRSRVATNVMIGLTSCPDIWDFKRWNLDQETGYFDTELSVREVRTALYSIMFYLAIQAA